MLPLWTADIDPDVIVAHAAPAPVDGDFIPLDLRSGRSHVFRGRSAEHVGFMGRGGYGRLDVRHGTLNNGPVAIRFELPLGPHLARQIAMVRRCAGLLPVAGPDRRAIRGLLAVQAALTRRHGAGLREIAASLFGPGAWPGDGDHRKSRVRRLVSTGDRLLAGGHRLLLAG